MSRHVAALLACTLALAACDSAPDVPGLPGGGEDRSAAQVRQPAAGEGPVLVPGDGAAEVAVGTSAALWASAPVVLVAPEDDPAAQARAAGVAVALGTPLLLTPEPAASPGASPSPEADDEPTSGTAGAGAGTPDGDAAVAAELDRLGVETVLAFSDAVSWAGLEDVEVVAAPADVQRLGEVTGLELTETPPAPAPDLLRSVAALAPAGEAPVLALAAGAGGAAGAGQDDPASPDGEPSATPGEEPDPKPLPDVEPPAPLADTVVLATGAGGGTGSLAAVATARAAGADVTVLDVPDPRESGEAVAALAGAPGAAVLALGDAFGPADRLAHAVAVAATGVQLPGGGQLVVPGRHLVALYGHPGTAALGVLGEQGLDASIARARRLAESYEPYADAPVVPTFEIITTIASAAAGADGDYSDEADVEELRPWVEAAGEAGVYVVLDLQPGRTDFLTQAQRYSELLAYPHVGLALDPEWRLKPDQRHLRQIGTVTAAEVNQVSDWLADLVRERTLPQKLLLLHQFRISMISDRDTLDLSHPELATLVQMDGHGTPGMKRETWGALTSDAQPELYFGWKNFYDEDTPTWTPAQTLALSPTPWFVSYQ